MLEHREPQEQPPIEAKLPQDELRPVVQDLHRKFLLAIEKSFEHPLWHLASAANGIEDCIPEYLSENDKWRVSGGRNSIFLRRDTFTDKGRKIEAMNLGDYQSKTWLNYGTITPDKNDPKKDIVFNTGDTLLAIENTERLISELPRVKK